MGHYMSLVRSVLYGMHAASGFLSCNLNLRMQWNLETELLPIELQKPNTKFDICAFQACRWHWNYLLIY